MRKCVPSKKGDLEKENSLRSFSLRCLQSQQSRKSMINNGYINHQAKFIVTRPILQTSFNLVIFGKMMVIFRRKDISMNVKSLVG